MKRFLIIIGLFWGLNLFGQNNNLKDLIISSLKLYEPNPTYIDETKALNEILIGLLRDSLAGYDTNIMELFDHVYDNASTDFEDDVDIRRIKTRQCLCYSSIALLSDKYRFEYFIDLAKYSISDSTDKPIEFLEKQYCGLIMLKILIKLRYDLKIQNDIKELDSKLSYFKKVLPLDYYNKSELIIKQYQNH
jgi:hypothetical protein